MITTYTQLYLVFFGGIIDFYSQKIFFYGLTIWI